MSMYDKNHYNKKKKKKKKKIEKKYPVRIGPKEEGCHKAGQHVEEKVEHLPELSLKKGGNLADCLTDN